VPLRIYSLTHSWGLSFWICEILSLSLPKTDSLLLWFLGSQRWSARFELFCLHDAIKYCDLSKQLTVLDRVNVSPALVTCSLTLSSCYCVKFVKSRLRESCGQTHKHMQREFQNKHQSAIVLTSDTVQLVWFSGELESVCVSWEYCTWCCCVEMGSARNQQLWVPDALEHHRWSNVQWSESISCCKCLHWCCQCRRYEGHVVADTS